MKKSILIAVIVAFSAAGAIRAAVPALPETVGSRTAALPDDAWLCSEWIAVPGAPEKTTMTNDNDQRAADGASWFCIDLQNDKKVRSEEHTSELQSPR